MTTHVRSILRENDYATLKQVVMAVQPCAQAIDILDARLKAIELHLAALSTPAEAPPENTGAIVA